LLQRRQKLDGALGATGIDDHEERQDRDILEQQDPRRHPSMGARQLPRLLQLLERNAGRAHRGGTAGERGRGPGHAEPPGDECRTRHAARHLQGARHEDRAPRRPHLGPRELEARHEHQQDETEVGEKVCALARRDEAKAERADHYACEQVPEDCGQTDAREERDRERGSADQRQRFDRQRFVHEPQG
jgi:hypothetical protein